MDGEWERADAAVVEKEAAESKAAEQGGYLQQ